MIMQALMKQRIQMICGYLPLNVKNMLWGVIYMRTQNGDEPYIFNPTGMDNVIMWENASIVLMG